MQRSLVPFVLALLGLLACRSGTAADISVRGAPQVVFASTESGCAANDIPDAPARAFRDRAETVRLFAAHASNRAFAGPTLEAVERDCRVAFQGGGDDDPAAFDDRIWLTSFWTADGEVVHALGHAEYHGHLRPDICPGGRYLACWWNAVVQLVSTDGGRTFRRAGAADRGLVAALPYRYQPGHGRPAGYFSPSNIIEHGGYWYVFVFAESFREQRRGACLLRTAHIEDPSSWRAWDGHDFTVPFVNPYVESRFRPGDHVCAPVPGVSSTISSVARRRGGGGFAAVIAASRRAEPNGEPVAGVYAMTSPDLIHWNKPKLLLPAPIMFAFPCEADWAYAYPSLLDENAAGRTFETISGGAYLYLSRINVRRCRLTMERQLVRYRLDLKEDPADRQPAERKEKEGSD